MNFFSNIWAKDFMNQRRAERIMKSFITLYY